MNSHIKGVVVFRDATKDGKRTLELSKGLNIITGHSKTGKSAILDIIDWCLGSKESTIPKGVITEFAQYYAILIDFNGVCLLLARGNGKHGRNYLHVSKISKDFTINQVDYSDIQKDNFFKREEALEKINSFIGLGFGENKLLDLDFKIPHVNIRSALAFNFQHQDIISSNSRLFYIDPVKTHFPVIAGWFNSDYYLVLATIEKLQKAINNLTKENQKAIKDNSKLEYNLRTSLRLYYNLIGIPFNNNWTAEDCINRIEELEDFKKEEFSNQIIGRQEELQSLIEKNQAENLQISRKLSILQTQKRKGSEYTDLVGRYKERASYFPVQPDYLCPICSKPNEKLSLEALSILEADKELKNELKNIPNQSNKFDNEIIELTDIKKELLAINLNLKKEFKQNEQVISKITKEKNLNEQKQKAQWKVISDAEIFIDRHIPVKDKILDEHQSNLDIFKERKKSYNENKHYEEACYIIEQRMSTIVTKLDYEHKPPELSIELKHGDKEAYKLIHNREGEEPMYLREIGSASNALACHVGLFLSFLYYFSHEPNSKVPSFLFFDQPSQVYFPSGKDNKDVEKVAQIYETILDEIIKIESETGIEPQIIVADHIKDLGDETVQLYGHYFKADWRDGDGFI